ncbi:MAG TPA: DUF4198 domain-containing protein [Desulfobulbus sp.]|nr:DUF4198 domain-containing protein [Desulfobulbus sp.]
MHCQEEKKTFGLVSILALAFLVVAMPVSALAHFGMLIPDRNIVTQDHRTASLTLSFSHPFAGMGMDMAKPAKFFVDLNGRKTDLVSTLQPTTVMGHKAWKTDYRFRRPGVYIFGVEPQPYWEPAEDTYIIHYTKTEIAAFGADEGWDRPIGLKTEIIPLLRPFGNYAGNSFVGKVLLDGRPVPGAHVEVEFYNRGQKLTAPSEYHVTQVVKTDSQGIFVFTCPAPGWWGFAALSEADYKLKGPDGKDKDVELGAILWTYLDRWPAAK